MGKSSPLCNLMRPISRAVGAPRSPIPHRDQTAAVTDATRNDRINDAI
jgi:hypothetical protein